ncbi:hypothetical protein DFJ73DRAFT_622380 [Zopfochytrium polystomum]|nr:hypothetical protein DFJ73DRAFT_622380 [Zopfochytrium polystomum]
MVPPGYPTELAQPFADLLTEHPHKMIMCSMVHPHDLTCEGRLFGEFGKEWWRAMALYAPLNAIMALIFRGPAGILRKPRRFLVSFIKSTLRSTLFLTAYCTIANYVPCKLRNWFGRDRTWFYYVNGLVAGSMVMIEAPGRRLELGMYCLPRAIESFWNCGVEWGWWRHIPGGEGIYFCLATGVLMTLYQQDPETILDG